MRRDWNKIISLLCAAVLLLGVCRDYAVSSFSGALSSLPLQNSVFKMPGVQVAYSKNYLSDTFVINIQDYHGDYSSQLAIRDILKKIASYGKKTEIYVEGAYKAVDLSYLEAVKNAPGFDAFSDILVKNGKLTGAELFALNESGSRLNGLEDLELYMRNLKNLSRLIADREAVLADFDLYANRAGAKLLDGLSPRAKKIYLLKQKYDKEKIEHGKYSAALLKYASDAGIEVKKDYPEVNAYAEAQALRARTNLKKAESDMRLFLDFVKGILSYKDYMLMENSANRLGALAAVYRAYSFKTAELTKFFSYADYQNKSNLSLLLEQEDALFWDIIGELSFTSSQKRNAGSLRALEYARKLLSGEIVPYEYAYLIKNENLFENAFGKYLALPLSDEIKTYYAVSKEFYEINEKRNGIFIEKAGIKQSVSGNRLYAVNGLEGAFEKASSVKVLVTGGYHGRGLSEILDGFGIAYAVLTPAVQSSGAGVKEMYERAITVQAAAAFSAFQRLLIYQDIITDKNGFNAGKFCETVLDRDIINFLDAQKEAGSGADRRFFEAIVRAVNETVGKERRLASLSFERESREKIILKAETENGSVFSEPYEFGEPEKQTSSLSSVLRSAAVKTGLLKTKPQQNILFEEHKRNLIGISNRLGRQLSFCRANPVRRELELAAPEILKTAASFMETLTALDAIYPELDYVRQSESEKLIISAYEKYHAIVDGGFDFGTHSAKLAGAYERMKKITGEFGLEVYEEMSEKLQAASLNGKMPSAKKTTREIEQNIMRYFAKEDGSALPVFAFAAALAKEKLGGEYDYDAADMTFKRIKDGFFRKRSVKRAGGAQNIAAALNRQSREIMPYFTQRLFAAADQEETEDALIRSLSSLEMLETYPEFADIGEIIKISEELFKACSEKIEIKTAENAYLDALQGGRESEIASLKKELDDKIEYARRLTVFQNELIKVIANIGKRNPAAFERARDFLISVSNGSVTAGRAGAEGMYWLRQQSILRLKDFNSPSSAEALGKIIEAENKGEISSPDSVFLSVNLEASNAKTLSLKLHAAGVLIDFNRQNAGKMLESDIGGYFRFLRTVPAKERFAYILAAADFISDGDNHPLRKAELLKGFSLLDDKNIIFSANTLLDFIARDFRGRDAGDAYGAQITAFLDSFAKALSLIAAKDLHGIKNNIALLKKGGKDSRRIFEEVLAEMRFELGNMGSGRDKPSGWISDYNVFMISGGGVSEDILRLENMNFSGRVAGLMSSNDDGGSTLLCRGYNAEVNGIYSLSQGDIVNFITSAASLDGSEAPLKNIIGELMNIRFDREMPLAEALAEMKPEYKEKAGEALSAEFENFWARLEFYARICDGAGFSINNNSLKNLVFEAIAFDNKAYGEGFLNPDGVYSSMKDFADFLGTKSMALSGMPYGNITTVKTKGGIEYLGQSYFSHTPHVLSGGRNRTFWTPDNMGEVFGTIGTESRVAESISRSKVIIAGLCSWITSLGVQLCNKDIANALALNEKADKILITNPVKDDENTMAWSESSVSFLQRISGRPLKELFNGVFAWQSAARDIRMPSGHLTEKEIFEGAAGGYRGENAISASGVRLLDKLKIKLHVISGSVSVKTVARRDDGSKINYKIAADPRVVASKILASLSRDNGSMVYGSGTFSSDKIGSSGMSSASALMFGAENPAAENRAESLLRFGVSSFVFLPLSGAEIEKRKLSGEIKSLFDYEGIGAPGSGKAYGELYFRVEERGGASVTKCYYAAETGQEAKDAVRELAEWFAYELPSLSEKGLAKHDQLFMIESALSDISFERLENEGASALKVLISGNPSSLYDFNLSESDAAEPEQYISALLNEMRKPVNAIAQRLKLYNRLGFGDKRNERLLAELKKLLIEVGAWDDKAKRAALLYALKSGFEIKVQNNRIRFIGLSGRVMPFYIDAAGRFNIPERTLEKMRRLESLKVFADMDDNIAQRGAVFSGEMQNIFADLTMYGICSPVVITGNTDKTLWVRFEHLPETVLEEMVFYTEVGGLRYTYGSYIDEDGRQRNGFVIDRQYTYDTVMTAIPQDEREKIRKLASGVDYRFDGLFVSFVKRTYGLANYEDIAIKALEEYAENDAMLMLIKKITGQGMKKLLTLHWKDFSVSDVQRVLDELASVYRDENAAAANGLAGALSEEQYLKALEIVSLLEYCRISFSQRSEDKSNKSVILNEKERAQILRGEYTKLEADSEVRISLTPIRVKHIKKSISDLYAHKFAAMEDMREYKVESSGRTTINIMKKICQKTLPIEYAIENAGARPDGIVYSGDEVFMRGMGEADSGIDDSVARLDLQKGREMLVVSTNLAMHNQEARPNLICLTELMRANGIAVTSPVDAGTFLHARILEKLEENFARIMTDENFEPDNIIRAFKNAFEQNSVEYPAAADLPFSRERLTPPVSFEAISEMLSAA